MQRYFSCFFFFLDKTKTRASKYCESNGEIFPYRYIFKIYTYMAMSRINL